LTIAFLDKVEEFRPLLAYERLFRNIIKTHIKNLLAMQKEYWRQRFTSCIVQFGDENTKFFHAMASERYRLDVISQLMDDTRRMVADHVAKSSLFFQEFRRRLGSRLGISMQFDTSSFTQPHNDLEKLCEPFSHEDIDNIILELPLDKAPGPDGFNNLFLKKD
jgi:hypothetical protein